MTAAFTFPGQGSQAVGMGKALADAFPAARPCSTRSTRRSARSSPAIIWEGPAETLQLTENAQPALMAVSIAALRVLEAEAGFSVAPGCRLRRRPFARRIFGAGRGRQPQPRRHRALAAHPRPRDAEGGAGRRRRDGGAARPRLRRGGRGGRAKRPRARSARSPTTTAAARSSSPATRPRSSAPSRSPRPRAPSARCCCRCPRRSIAR